jgi:hypothetical protein
MIPVGTAVPAEEYVTLSFAICSCSIRPAAEELVLSIVDLGILYDALRACDRNDVDTKDGMYFDIAAALWVSTGQLKEY